MAHWSFSFVIPCIAKARDCWHLYYGCWGLLESCSLKIWCWRYPLWKTTATALCWKSLYLRLDDFLNKFTWALWETSVISSSENVSSCKFVMVDPICVHLERKNKSCPFWHLLWVAWQWVEIEGFYQAQTLTFVLLRVTTLAKVIEVNLMVVVVISSTLQWMQMFDFLSAT